MDDARPLKIRSWLALAFALFVLNSGLTLHNVWPTAWVRLRPELSIELAVLVLALVAWASFVRPVGRFALAVLTAVMLVLVVGRYAEVTAPALYGRPVNLYWDAEHLPKVGAMLAEVAPLWLVAVGALGLVALLTALVAALAWCLRCVIDGLRARPTRRALGVASAAVVALFAASYAFDSQIGYRFSLPVSETLSAASAVHPRRARGGAEPLAPDRALAAHEVQPPRGRRRAADVSRVLWRRDLRHAGHRARRGAGARRARARGRGHRAVRGIGVLHVADVRRRLVARARELHERAPGQRHRRLHAVADTAARYVAEAVQRRGLPRDRCDAGHEERVARGRLLRLRRDSRRARARLPRPGFWLVADTGSVLARERRGDRGQQRLARAFVHVLADDQHAHSVSCPCRRIKRTGRACCRRSRSMPMP